MKIEIISRKFVSPSHPTPSKLRNYKLSFIDQLSAPAYTSFIFFYTPPCNDLINRLEKSLSDILTLYYPFAGRYIDDLHAIDCCDDGAEFLLADVNSRLDRFLQEKNLDTKILNQLVPYPKEFPLSTPLLAIQINRFECNRLAIGFSISHKLADGFTYFSFINHWANVCKQGDISPIKPLYLGLQSVLPAKDVIKTFEVPIPVDPATKFVTRRFTISNESLSKFKNSSNLHPSRVEVVAALTWKAKISINRAKFGQLRPSILIFLMDLRGKTSLDVPKNVVVGNFIQLVLARFNPTKTKLSFNDLLRLIRTAKTKTEDFVANCDGESIFLSRISAMKIIDDELRRGKTDISVLTSLCRVPYYEADFGWGEPSWVSSVHKPTEIIHLLDTKCRTGIEAFISMEERDMLQFEKDKDILALTSSVVSKL